MEIGGKFTAPAQSVSFGTGEHFLSHKGASGLSCSLPWGMLQKQVGLSATQSTMPLGQDDCAAVAEGWVRKERAQRKYSPTLVDAVTGQQQQHCFVWLCLLLSCTWLPGLAQTSALMFSDVNMQHCRAIQQIQSP